MSEKKLFLCVRSVFDDHCWAKLMTLTEFKDMFIPDRHHKLISDATKTAIFERHGDYPSTLIWGETEPGSALEDFNYHTGTRLLVDGRTVYTDLKPQDQAEHDEAYEGACDLCTA